ncbi:hypothetical protein F2Q69_00014142 [Brassica cretica]|uniref:Uncharacterized protein n=1 Tax=Brassica cretica TaxID=69181 RepID=A0A8S9QVN5_BRACR|nr:hypothetical protein F2Q69_00014142 [Brassica cretica]
MAYGLSRSVIRILCSLGMNEVEERWIWWGALTLMQSNTTCSCSFFRLQHLLRKEWDRNVVVMDRRIRLQWLDMGVYRDKNARVVHATHVLSLRVSTYALIFSVGIDGMILLWRKMSSIEADRGLTLALNQAEKLRVLWCLQNKDMEIPASIGQYGTVWHKRFLLQDWARDEVIIGGGGEQGDRDVTVWHKRFLLQDWARDEVIIGGGGEQGDRDVTVWYAEMIQELSRNYSGRH